MWFLSRRSSTSHLLYWNSSIREGPAVLFPQKQIHTAQVGLTSCSQVSASKGLWSVSSSGTGSHLTAKEMQGALYTAGCAVSTDLLPDRALGQSAKGTAEVPRWRLYSAKMGAIYGTVSQQESYLSLKPKGGNRSGPLKITANGPLGNSVPPVLQVQILQGQRSCSPKGTLPVLLDVNDG